MLWNRGLDRYMMCETCGWVLLEWSKERNGLVEFRTGKKHECDQSRVYNCQHCNAPIYLDKKVLSLDGRRIPLDFQSDRYHFCRTEKNDHR